jgi:hypothetical protein
MKILALTKVLTLFASVMIVAIAGQHAAQAQRYTNYPFCAYYGREIVSCGFNTMAQCLASASGRGGFCEANGDYAPATVSPRRPRNKS